MVIRPFVPADEPLPPGSTQPARAQCLANRVLDHGEDGLTVIERMRNLRPGLSAILITAEPSAPIRQRAAAMGVEVLAKPVAPAAIEAFLAGVSVLEVEPE